MFVSPMLLLNSKNNKPFNSKDHITELKLDGIRCIVSKLDKLYAYTKDNTLITNKFPELHKCPIPDGTILDGELVVLDHKGKPDFEAMSSRLWSVKNKTPVIFCAFDLIRYKGIDVTDLPLMKRKELLEEAFTENEVYKKMKLHEGKASDYFAMIQKQGLEGIVIKSKKSKYSAGKRQRSWQQVINWVDADVCISGFRKKDYSLLASIDSANGTKYPVGLIQNGITAEHKTAINRIKKRLVYKEDSHFAYMEPLLTAKVKTRGWTNGGKLRSPEFVGFVV